MLALAAGVRTLFRDPNLSLPATYTSATGVTVDIRVLRFDTTDAVVGGSATMGTTAEQDAAEIMQSDVPEKPIRGASLSFGGQTFAIRSSATPAKRGLTWRVVLTDG